MNLFKSKQTEAQKIEDALVKDKENSALIFIIFMVAIGVIGIFIYSCQNIVSDNSKIKFNFNAVCSSLLFMAGAAFAMGSVMGFLFGIPRSASESSNSASNVSGYVGNDNLLQVSDWLTKIIVGVGLTQLYSIPNTLKKYAVYLSKASGVDNVALIIFIMLYFSVFGFLFGYLWTRLYFVGMLKDSDEDSRKELQKKLEDNKENISLIQDYISTGAQVATKESLTDDPQKGKFGGLRTANSRTVEATVSESNISKDFFNVSLKVNSTDINKALEGEVKFFLHPSFRSPNPTIKVINGIASLNVLAIGAFTIGVECDNGNTKLEIDLSEISNAPRLFRER